MVPFDILLSWELMLLHRWPRATHLPLMLLDLVGTSRKCVCLLAPSPPVTAPQPLPPPLSNTFPFRHAQGQPLPISHHFFWFIKTSARALVAVAVMFVFFLFLLLRCTYEQVTHDSTWTQLCSQRAPLGEENQIPSE